MLVCSSGDENAQEDREGGGFGSGGEECGDGGRRALVDVGRPDLERRGGHFEGEADEHQGGGHGQNGVARLVQHGAAHQQQVDAAGSAVDQRHAVEKEGGGEAAQQEILERGFVAALIVAQIAGQDVARNGRNLQADEDHDQVVGCGHQALSGDGKQQQRVVFAGLGVLLRQEPVGRQNGQHADHDHQNAEKGGEAIHHEQAAKRRSADGVRVDAGAERSREREQAEMPEGVRRALVDQRIEHHQQGAHHGQNDFGQEAQGVLRVEDRTNGHGRPPCLAALSSTAPGRGRSRWSVPIFGRCSFSRAGGSSASTRPSTPS